MKPLLIYCYDAYCGWCYGFSPVIKKIAANYSGRLDVEVLSGGMLTGEYKIPIEKISPLIREEYARVEEIAGVKYGEDFLWHVFNPEKSDWVMNSEKPAIALCIFKEIYPERQLEFGADLQYSLNYEGRDLDDDEAYRHLLEKYELNEDDFYTKLKNSVYKEKAYYEFALCRQLQVNGFPSLLLEVEESKFYLLARGFTSENDVLQRLQQVLAETGHNQ